MDLISGLLKKCQQKSEDMMFVSKSKYDKVIEELTSKLEKLEEENLQIVRENKKLLKAVLSKGEISLEDIEKCKTLATINVNDRYIFRKGNLFTISMNENQIVTPSLFDDFLKPYPNTKGWISSELLYKYLSENNYIII